METAEYLTAKEIESKINKIKEELSLLNNNLISPNNLGCMCDADNPYGQRLAMISTTAFDDIRAALIADLQSQKAELITQFNNL